MCREEKGLGRGIHTEATLFSLGTAAKTLADPSKALKGGRVRRDATGLLSRRTSGRSLGLISRRLL